MAARPIASGIVSFALVVVPVKLYPATRSKSLSFNMLHKKDRSRLKQQYVCSACSEVVERDDTVRGYEYAKGEYAVFSEDELATLEQKSDQSIEIEQFVPIEKVDPVYFDKAYLLGPDKGGHKPYASSPRRCARAASARSRSSRRAASSSSCCCARPSAASSCTPSSTPTRCARSPTSN
jgi:DNA end-binding protein Ku